ncbi:MAG: WXG100 family type VII secretion target [Clostridia bacterium]|nr:WXG100 family type VII secretion target [Clostridia bacterium]
MKRIEIDTDLLSRSASGIVNDINDIKTQIDNVYEGIRVLDTMWDGSANEAFKQQFALDYDRMVEICDVLYEYADKLTEAKGRYESGENSVASIIAAIGI